MEKMQRVHPSSHICINFVAEKCTRDRLIQALRQHIFHTIMENTALDQGFMVFFQMTACEGHDSCL